MKIIRIDKWNIFEIFIQIYMYFSLHEEKNEKKKKKNIGHCESLFLNELVKLTQAQESPLSQMNEKSAEGWKLIFHLFY